MSWQESFTRALIEAIVFTGGKVSESASRYGSYGGWQDYGSDEPDHLRECGVDIARSSYADGRWTEFEGTFAEQPWSEHTGIDALVSCNCVLVSDSRYRYAGDYAELIRKITS